MFNPCFWRDETHLGGLIGKFLFTGWIYDQWRFRWTASHPGSNSGSSLPGNYASLGKSWYRSRTLADWAEEHGVMLAFIQPGKPAQNAYIERFNRTYREAVLDAYLFHTVAEVQAFTQDWLENYNANRPHESLGNLPPYQYAPKQPWIFHFQMVLILGPLYYHYYTKSIIATL